MNKRDVVERILADRPRAPRETGSGRAAANIALCKYWGKRDEELNLPVTGSCSYTLSALYAETEISPRDGADEVLLNGRLLPARDPFAARLTAYLDLVRSDHGYRVATHSTVPIAAGVASSSAGFAALVRALNDLYTWRLDDRACSILARLGSGSACRSLFPGFVEWHAGTRPDGMDSFAEPLSVEWPAFRMGLLYMSQAPKPIGSRAAMQRTRATSRLYRAWPDQVAHDLAVIRDALAARDFERLGSAVETNALAMHATMLAASPPVFYWLPDTVAAWHQVWSARADGLAVYATMDAGPNIKLLYLAPDEEAVRARFAGLHPA